MSSKKARSAFGGVHTKADGLPIANPVTAATPPAPGKELLADVESETSGHLSGGTSSRDILSALTCGPVGYDNRMLHEALIGVGYQRSTNGLQPLRALHYQRCSKLASLHHQHYSRFMSSTFLISIEKMNI
ncbi:hypothetical protein GGU11DRAFT_756436 [Lentinula aff. detonsa]|nr:hypothetical protein GGU11DRAFT_756436 [Lentinula aff. detonsa]